MRSDEGGGGSLPSAAPSGEATARLYDRYAKQLYGLCLFKLGAADEAEEAVQTIFLKVLGAMKGGVKPDREAAWLYTIALNVCRSQYRSRNIRSRNEIVSDIGALQHAPSAEPPTLETSLLLPALATLPARARHALLLREWQGLSYREIAERLESSEAAVETLLFRARRSLARALQTGPPPAPPGAAPAQESVPDRVL